MSIPIAVLIADEAAPAWIAQARALGWTENEIYWHGLRCSAEAGLRDMLTAYVPPTTEAEHRAIRDAAFHCSWLIRMVESAREVGIDPRHVAIFFELHLDVLHRFAELQATHIIPIVLRRAAQMCDALLELVAPAGRA